MSEADEFPGNLVAAIIEAAERVEGVVTVIGRALRPEDPNATVGVYAVDWVPGEHAVGYPLEPVDGKYLIHIQALVKSADEVSARALHSVLSKRLRVMVYRDSDLRVRLAALSETSDGVKERVQKWDVPAQRYLSNEIAGSFLYLSTTELAVTASIEIAP